MPKDISHEEIAERFIQAKVVDFAAMGMFVAEFGPSLAVNDRGWHGVNFGRFNILACMMPALVTLLKTSKVWPLRFASINPPV